MKAHVKKSHSEAVKRKAEELAEQSKLEVLHADKVPRLNVEEQIGGDNPRYETYCGSRRNQVTD